jgi:hypothetical protein
MGEREKTKDQRNNYNEEKSSRKIKTNTKSLTDETNRLF